jgi:hypothetical protein
MNHFEFIWAFYGLLLGLAVAELLGGFAALLRERAPPRLGIVTPLLGLQILVEMLTNYVDAWSLFRGRGGVSLGELAVPTLIGLLYYVSAVIIVPRQLSEWASLDDYFDKRRRWIVGTLLLANATITASFTHSWLARFSENRAWVGVYVVQVGSLLGAYTFLLLTRSRRLSVVAILFLMLWFLVFYGPFPIVSAFLSAAG